MVGQIPDGTADPHGVVVPQKAPYFPHDHGHAVGGKPHIEGRVKVVDGLDEADAPHLKQIVQIFAPGREFLDSAQHQPQIALDHLLAGLLVPCPRRLEQGRLFLLVQHRKAGGVHPAKLHFSCIHTTSLLMGKYGRVERYANSWQILHPPPGRRIPWRKEEG